MSSKMVKILKITLLLGLSLTLIGASPIESKKEEVRIAPWSDQITIGPKQVGVLRWGWNNCTRGLTSDWSGATLQHYTLKRDGQVIQEITAKQAEKYWGTAEINDALIEQCIWPTNHAWVTTWEYKHLKLNTPGNYELEVYISLEEPLIDGYDFDQNGEADWYEGIFFDRIIAIEVIK